MCVGNLCGTEQMSPRSVRDQFGQNFGQRNTVQVSGH